MVVRPLPRNHAPHTCCRVYNTSPGTTAPSKINKNRGGRIHETSLLSKAGNTAVKKWLAAPMASTSRRKALGTLEHRDKGLHSVVAMSPSARATALYWGQKVVLGGADRLLATTSPDAHGEPKLRLADLDALTRVVYAVLPADAVEGLGLCAGAPFTKAKAAADFPAVADLLPADADDDSDKFVAVQFPVALLV